MAKEHKWVMQSLEHALDLDSESGTLIRSRLINTDGRRRIKYFTVLFEPGKFTLSTFADLFREGQKQVDIQEGKRPKKHKRPQVDPRQAEMFPEATNVNLAT